MEKKKRRKEKNEMRIVIENTRHDGEYRHIVHLYDGEKHYGFLYCDSMDTKFWGGFCRYRFSTKGVMIASISGNEITVEIKDYKGI